MESSKSTDKLQLLVNSVEYILDSLTAEQKGKITLLEINWHSFSDPASDDEPVVVPTLRIEFK